MTELADQQTFLDSKQNWRISSLVPAVDTAEDGFAKAIQAIETFNEKFSGKAIVDTVEIKAPKLEQIASTIQQMPDSLNAFLEVPHQGDPVELIKAIAQAPDNIFAKIRTGGVTPDLIPSPAEVARFIYRCGQHQAGFKATAGLHHPLRGDYRLTYEPDAQQGTMFGFVNVFAAACFAFSGCELKPIEQLLVESDPNAFEFSDAGLTWNGSTVSREVIDEMRRNKAISFGSCSFTEPTLELAELGLSAACR